MKEVEQLRAENRGLRAKLDQLGVTVVKQRREIDALRESPLVTWEEGEGFQVNGVTVRAAVDPAVGGAELYTPCVPVSMIGKRGILRFTIAEDVPPGEVHFRDRSGKMIGKAVNLATGPEGTAGHTSRATFETAEGEAAAHANDGEWLQPSTNPFGHGCCDCGLYHDVEFRLVDGEGEGENFYRNQLESGALNLQFRFTRNATETARLRAHQAGEVCESCQKPLIGEDMETAVCDGEGVWLCRNCHNELLTAASEKEA